MENSRNQNDFNLIGWYQRHRLAVARIICLIVFWLSRQSRKRSRNMLTYSSLNSERERVREEVMDKIMGSEGSREVIRMGPKAFLDLCAILERDGGLRATKRVSVEEQVAKTLYVLGHHSKNREMQLGFLPSGGTISRHFYRVLRSIIELEEKYLKQPDNSEVPTEILGSSRFYPYFKDCIGTIGGTHVSVKVSPEDAPKYHDGKEYPTQKVLAACTFDLRFTYVLTGWEGRASNSRIIKNALSREDKLGIPSGKYYIADAGFMLKSGLIAPYKGVRYHLKEYARTPPQNSQELFNLQHASLQNAIKRAFGVLKKRFPIIASSNEPTYGVRTQNVIILACCILHNYLMGVDLDEELIAKVDEEIMNEVTYANEDEDTDKDDYANEDTVQGQYIRDSIASSTWNNYDLLS